MSWLRKWIARSWIWLRSFEPITVPPPNVTEQDIHSSLPALKFYHLMGLGNYNGDTAASWLLTFTIMTARSTFAMREFMTFVTERSDRAEQVKVQTGLFWLATQHYVTGRLQFDDSEDGLTIMPQLFNRVVRRDPVEVIEMGDGEEEEI